jgi:hypothetical protein
MTILSKEITNTPPPTSTLAAIARSISDQVTGRKPNKQSHDKINNPTWQTVQKIQRTASKTLTIPKIIPPPTNATVQEYATKFCNPIRISIPHPNSTKSGRFDKRRIILALLHAFQQLDATANIHPTLTSECMQDQENTLRKDDDIPTLENDLNKYLEISPTTTSDCFQARILINSAFELHHFKRDPNFVSWLKSEHIQLDRNPLQQTMTPHQVGFFTHIVPRTDQTSLYERRAQLSVTPNCPPFFIQIKYLTSTYVTTKVWNVYTAKDHADLVTEELKLAFNLPDLHQFYSWKEYRSLQPCQQVTILQIQNQFLSTYRSLLIHGFNPHDSGSNTMWHDNLDITQTLDEHGQATGQWHFTDDIEENDMNDESIEDRFHNGMNLKTTTITDFIQHSFQSGDNTHVFAHVYQPILGTREVLVQKHHIPEALDLIKLIKFDLCRTMNHKAIIDGFNNYEDIILGTTTHDPWKPFDIQHKIPKTNVEHRFTNTGTTTNPPRKSKRSTIRNNNVSYARILIPHHQDNFTDADIESMHTPTATSTITSLSSGASRPTKTSDLIELSRLDAIQNSIVTLQESLASVAHTVAQNQQNHDLALEQLESRTTLQIEHNTTIQKQQLEDIGTSFLNQMKSEQTSTSQIIREMLAEREISIENKMKDGFQALISQISGDRTSPTRKKHATHPDTDHNHPNKDAQNVTMTEYTSAPHQITNPTPTINPYDKSSLRRRSVNSTLPTTTP